MSLTNYRIILEKIAPHAQTVGLYNYGEPLLNKDIWKMVSLTSERGISTSIHSNLTTHRFDEKEAENIIQSGLSHLSASIDGTSQETYGKYRVRGDYSLAIANLEQLQKAKDRLRSGTPELVWGFLVNRYNEHEQAEAKSIAANMGIRIKFSLMDVWGDETWESMQHKSAKASTAVKDDVHSTNRPLPTSFDEVTLHPKLHSWCIQPFKIMIVNWNGNVLPCCTVYDDRFSLGNLLTTDLEALWNNLQFRSCRLFLHSYGPQQRTGSKCEVLPCPVRQKSLS
jgi:radical SAM protein with 4Fe4S-binding SPASM domain